MTKRRTFLALSALTASIFPLKAVLGQSSQKANDQADFLFVQTAKSMRFDSATNKLMLDDVSPVTLFFSDRPERIRIH